MRARGASFAEVLAEAQARGYAEADPTFDVEGIDAAHKLTIMSAIAFGVPMQFDKAYAEGITRLTREDIRYAEELGYRIKLLGITRRARVDGREGIELRVHPTLVPTRRLIANVEGAMNAVLVKGDAVGATLYYGPGAGAEPTASAVIADLVDVTRMHTADPEHRVPHLAFQPDQLTDVPFLPMGEVVTSYYLRMRVEDKPGVLADITRILADRDISIDAMIQKEPPEGEDQTDIILLDAPVDREARRRRDPRDRGAADGARLDRPHPARGPRMTGRVARAAVPRDPRPPPRWPRSRCCCRSPRPRPAPRNRGAGRWSGRTRAARRDRAVQRVQDEGARAEPVDAREHPRAGQRRLVDAAARRRPEGQPVPHRDPRRGRGDGPDATSLFLAGWTRLDQHGDPTAPPRWARSRGWAAPARPRAAVPRGSSRRPPPGR